MRGGNKAEKEKTKSFYNGQFGEIGYDFEWCSYLLQDKDGRAIYYMRGRNMNFDYTSDYRDMDIIAITSPDGEFYEDGWFIFDFKKIYTGNLKSIKEATGWNMKAE